jgi:hypothetical protein
MKNANALAGGASRNGNNAATGVRLAYVPAHLRGHLATACEVQTKFESPHGVAVRKQAQNESARGRNISAGV